MEALFVDRKAVQVENLFLDFLKSFRADTDSGGGGPLYYESEVEAMKANESNTVFIDFSHVMTFSDPLQSAISDEYLRFEASLKNACKRFVTEQNPSLIADDSPNKDVNVAFFNLPYCKRLRELTTAEIGKLVSLTGVITRTSEVRPELLYGTFKCLDCGGVIRNVEQQFKYTEVALMAWSFSHDVIASAVHLLLFLLLFHLWIQCGSNVLVVDGIAPTDSFWSPRHQEGNTTAFGWCPQVHPRSFLSFVFLRPASNQMIILA